VALRIEMELAEDIIRGDPEQGILRLHDLGQQLDEAIDELRALAHGVYSPILADRGLEEAVRAVAARSGVPLDVSAHGVGRYPPEVESAVYFCMLEALQNVLKHAVGVHRVEVVLADANGELSFTVRDDGAGATDLDGGAGRGMANMRDRVASVGGSLDVRSTPQVGTVVRGRVPAPLQDRLAAPTA
jgi:signal transduction histidine kinase